MRAHRVQGDGVTLAVQEHGDPAAPTVLLVHGFPDTQGLWSLVVPRLADRYHVVTYDLRGAGESSAPAGPGEYRLEQLARDARAVIDACAPEQKVHLVGHDWGSIQGWEFIYAEPTADRIASFTSVCGASFDHVGLLLRDRLRHPTPSGLARTLGQFRRSWYMLALQAPKPFGLVWRELIGPRWGWILARREGVPADPDFPAPTVPGDGANLAGLYFRTPIQRMLHPRRTGQVQLPVQVIRPLGDKYLSEHTLENVEEFVPELTRRTVPGGHWAPRTQPGPLAELIAAHVERSLMDSSLR